METGALDLKAWGLSIAPQAQLHFNGELVLKNQYVPVLGFFREGTKLTAQRCTRCRVILFEYR